MWYFLLSSLAIFSVGFFPALPNTSTVFFLFLLTVWLCYQRYFLIACIIGGYCFGIGYGQYLIDKQIPSSLEGESLRVVGVVQGLPKQTDNKLRFLFYIQAAIGESRVHNEWLAGKKVQLTRYSYHQKMRHGATVVPGQQWQLTIKLRRPRGLVNPFGFDYQAYLLRQNISATGYVINSGKTLLLDSHCKREWISCLRWNIREYFIQFSSNTASLGPLVALIIGDTQWLQDKQWALLKNTGTIHLFAISGLHISLAAVIGFFIGRIIVGILCIRSPLSLLYHYLPSVFSILFSVIYSLLAGMGLPAQRALIMVVIFHLGKLFFARSSPLFVFSCALFFIALVDPLATQSQGFWLSFLAVAFLIYGFIGRKIRTGNIADRHISPFLKAQWILTIGLFIPSILWLQGISLIAPLANLIAVSWVSLCIVPLLFFTLFLLMIPLEGLLILVKGIYTLLEMQIQWLFSMLQWIDNSWFSFWYFPFETPGKSVVLLAFVAVFYVLSPKGMPHRYLSLLCCLPIFFSLNKSPPLKITFLDAGQGTAIVVRTKTRQLVYDVGREFSRQFNIGEHVVSPYLRSQGILDVDLLLVSHIDKDHSGGVTGLFSSIGVEHVLSGQPDLLRQSVSAMNTIDQCYAGQQWTWDNVSFLVVWPEHRYLSSRNPSNNNLSCVLLISYKGHHVLLTGDIEKEAESYLEDSKLLPEQLDILLVPHHGSRTSSTLSWLKQLSPKWSVITAGYKNVYKHPHPMVTARYDNLNSQLINTASSGAIKFTLGDDGAWRLEQWRQDYRRYWYD